MNKIFKSVFTFILGLAALFAVAIGPVTANAQARYDSSYTITASSNSVSILPLAASTASNVTVVVDCRLQDKITLQFDAQLSAAGAWNLSFPIQRSGDGVTFSPITTEYITLPFNGIALNCFYTNIPTYGLGFIKIPYFTNAHATINCTNLVIRPILKRNAP